MAALLDHLAAEGTVEGFDESLARMASHARLTDEELLLEKREAYARLVRSLIVDGQLQEEEKRRLDAFGEKVGVAWGDLSLVDRDLVDYRLAAYVRVYGPYTSSDGKGLLLKPDEQHCYEFTSWITDRVPVQEFHAATLDVQVPIGKSGLGVGAGTINGQMAPTGEMLTISDKGSLHLTTRRVVFIGSRRSIDIPIDDITSYRQSEGVLRISSSSRSEIAEFSVGREACIAEATIEWLRTPRPTTRSMSIAPPSEDDDCPVLDFEEFIDLLQNPDKKLDTRITVYGSVVQFDKSTGPNLFIGRVHHEPIDTTTPVIGMAWFAGFERVIADLVAGDLFEARVSVMQSLSLDTPAGKLTLPSFAIGSYRRMGTEGEPSDCQMGTS